MEPLRVRGRVYGSLSRSCPRLLDYAGLILDLIHRREIMSWTFAMSCPNAWSASGLRAQVEGLFLRGLWCFPGSVKLLETL